MGAAISSSNTSLSAFGTIDVIDRVPLSVDKPEIPACRWPA